MAKINSAAGLQNPLQNVFPQPVISSRAPTPNDKNYPLGFIWVNKSSNTSWILTSVNAGAAVWSISSAGTTDLATLSGDSGGNISPVGSNITLAGGTNITTVGAGSTITSNLDPAITLATSITSPTYTSAAAMAISAAAATDITIKMGNTGGANNVFFTDSAGSPQLTLDSAGTILAKDIQTEFILATGTDIILTESPIMQTAATTGGVPTGGNTDLNLMTLQSIVTMEQFIVGGQTIIAPRMTANGLDISLDQTNTEGAEYNFGTLTNSKHVALIGSTPAFFMEATIYLEDVSGCNGMQIGFRKIEANQADIATYTDYATIGAITSVTPTNVALNQELNGTGSVFTNTMDAWADASALTLKILVSSGGVVTYTINGAAPTVNSPFVFDNGDLVMPIIRTIQGPDLSGVIGLQTLKIGLQA